MTEQERNVLLNELRQQESQREKQIKRERFRRLNPYAKKGAVVFAGSSLMEQFPLYEFLQDDDLHCTLYNRGIGGFTTTELLEAMDECIFELQPAHLFLNIGTNDLTQTGLGMSRDDSGSFLPQYQELEIIKKNVFASIDQNGVGKLMKIAVELGRSTRPDIKLGICGEHGGDPASVKFCNTLGLTYVSCSPYRVPTARLAAAQAALEQE